MNLTISSLLILLFSLPHSSFAVRILEDAEVNKVIIRDFSTNVEDMSFVGGDHHVRRKVLHEVYSGTNPVGNSIDRQQRWRPKSRSTIRNS
ncbi:hypothetical protein I3843_11G150400 [Carya illinoinensis]|uniref:Uncharacterized protein n=1 Tax=Carya illinoinensis TaxID=32201 RepID=A0A8T1P6W6_CARIL|nr:hypothetical protein I3760_11G150500 [Carya illinoinensis]KAG6637072.1 hypothetical protein CIPAW_11G154700 [Carya illinoinensis]KAG6688970.1 hypothetical protein I3842_11G153200 [Carya illinoinensis]KAG7956946.1 hypothetical protein I3843_11G150400 [Carya illinoinensis]